MNYQITDYLTFWEVDSLLTIQSQTGKAMLYWLLNEVDIVMQFFTLGWTH